MALPYVTGVLRDVFLAPEWELSPHAAFQEGRTRKFYDDRQNPNQSSCGWKEHTLV